MKAELEDALVPVKWADAQIPTLQQRLIDWNRSGPYEVIIEPDPQRSDRELLVAYLKKQLDPLIIGDVGAIINSVRTGLDLMMAAVVGRHGVVTDRAPGFPIRTKPADFYDALQELETEHGISIDEALAIKRTKAYNGGDHVLVHIRDLDNLRKHQRILVVKPIPTQVDITQIYMVERIMTHSHAQNKTTLYRIPAGTFRPTKGNTNLSAEIFLNETAPIGVRPALVAVRVYVERVKALIDGFPVTLRTWRMPKNWLPLFSSIVQGGRKRRSGISPNLPPPRDASPTRQDS